MSDIVRRQKATQATVDAFKGRPFRFGVRDCARMAAAHLRRLGHQVKLPPSGSYGSARSAAVALRERGFADLGAALDSMGFERIAPAAALVGDVLMLPGDGPFGGALTVAVGNGRVLGYHEDAVGADILQPVQFVTAWRVEPA